MICHWLGWPINRFNDLLTDWITPYLTEWPDTWLNDPLPDWMTYWLSEWLNNWLTNSVNNNGYEKCTSSVWQLFCCSSIRSCVRSDQFAGIGYRFVVGWTAAGCCFPSGSVCELWWWWCEFSARIRAESHHFKGVLGSSGSSKNLLESKLLLQLPLLVPLLMLSLLATILAPKF